MIIEVPLNLNQKAQIIDYEFDVPSKKKEKKKV